MLYWCTTCIDSRAQQIQSGGQLMPLTTMGTSRKSAIRRFTSSGLHSPGRTESALCSVAGSSVAMKIRVLAFCTSDTDNYHVSRPHSRQGVVVHEELCE